jgi:heme oxygenase (mycobilin-producing)
MSNVILINPFEVPAGREDECLAMWDEVAEYLRKQSGFVSTKLHRSFSPDARFRFINVAEWESQEQFQQAMASDGFRRLSAGISEAFTSYPGLYEVIRT